MLPSRSEHDFVDRRNVIPIVIHVLQLHLGLFALRVTTGYHVSTLRGALLPLQMLPVPVIIPHSWSAVHEGPLLHRQPLVTDTIWALGFIHVKGERVKLGDSLITTWGRCRIWRRFAVSRFPHRTVIRSAARMRSWLISSMPRHCRCLQRISASWERFGMWRSMPGATYCSSASPLAFLNIPGGAVVKVVLAVLFLDGFVALCSPIPDPFADVSYLLLVLVTLDPVPAGLQLRSSLF